MPVKTTIPYNSGTFYITFTCHNWLSLIEKANGYDIVYNWFDYLKEHGHIVNGFVSMPNHIHAILSFRDVGKSINTIIGNGKRFMAYEIINRLKQNGETDLLALLSKNVEQRRKQNNKQHEVWELSFDWKYCRTRDFILQKLNYIHANPCVKKWQLCNSPIEYLHSSAKYYANGEHGIYEVSNFMELDDFNFG